MTFGPDHYVPVLKIKRGEKAALQLVAPFLQEKMTPLLEVVERKGGAIGNHLDKAFKG